MGYTDMGIEAASTADQVELCRRFNRKAADKYAEQGADPAAIAVAAVYSAVDVANALVGHPAAAIAWVHSALEALEAGLPLTVKTLQ